MNFWAKYLIWNTNRLGRGGGGGGGGAKNQQKRGKW